MPADSAQLVQSGPRRGQPKQNNRLDLARTWQAIEWCEAKLDCGLSAPEVITEAQRPPPDGLGFNRWTATRYVRCVLSRLQRDVIVEPTESKRARMAKFWRGQIKRALGHKKVVVSDNGTQVVVDAPDLRAANQAGAMLMKVELGIDPTL